MTLRLRYMRIEDVAQVVQIDRVSFSSPWSYHSYAHEVNDAGYSHMLVLEGTVPSAHPQAQQPWWRRFVRQQNGSKPAPTIIGYGGLWCIADEAHISTIAVHPDYRGKGYGEALLAAMLRRAVILGAAYVILEVRVSNTVAKNLYQKYGFRYTHTKPGYYRDNNEDADELRVDIDAAAAEYFTQAHVDLIGKHGYVDSYTERVRP